jgi:hypothetical protein
MNKDGLGLAKRFRAVLDDAQVDAERARVAREARLAEGRAARDALYDSIAAFAAATGHLHAVRSSDGLLLSWRDRAIQFEDMGLGDRVRVTHDVSEREEIKLRLYRVEDLANRWVLSQSHRGQELVSPLFDQGLEDLLVEGLGLPRPDRDALVLEASQQQPALDELVPSTDASATDDGAHEPRRTL